MTVAIRSSRIADYAKYAAAPIVALGTAPLLARVLGPAERGHYGVALAVSSIIASLFALGQPEYVLAQLRSGRQIPRLSVQLVAGAGFVAGLVTFAVCVLLELPVLLSLLAAIAVCPQPMVALWRSIAIGNGRGDVPANGVFLSSVLRFGALVALAVGGLLNAASGVLIFQISTVLGTGVFMTWWLRKRDRMFEPGAGALGAIGPIVLFNLLTAVMMRSDILVLQVQSTETQVGSYAVAVSLSTSALAVSGAAKTRIQTALINGHSRQVRRDLAVLALLVGLGVVLVLALAPVLASLFFGSDYPSAPTLLRWICLTTVGLILLDLAYGVLIVLGKRGSLALVAFVGAVVTLTAVWLLTGVLGAVGAALGSFAGYVAALLAAAPIIWRAVRRVAGANS